MYVRYLSWKISAVLVVNIIGHSPGKSALSVATNYFQNNRKCHQIQVLVFGKMFWILNDSMPNCCVAFFESYYESSQHLTSKKPAQAVIKLSNKHFPLPWYSTWPIDIVAQDVSHIISILRVSFSTLREWDKISSVANISSPWPGDHFSIFILIVDTSCWAVRLWWLG